MTINETALRECRATVEDLEKALVSARVKAEGDEASPGLIYELQGAESLAERLRHLLGYIKQA